MRRDVTCGVLVGLIVGLFIRSHDRPRSIEEEPQPRKGIAPGGDKLTSILDASFARRVGTQSESWNSLLLIMTFAEATAATLVATALQVNSNTPLVIASCVALGLGALWIIAVLFLDRRVAEDQKPFSPICFPGNGPHRKRPTNSAPPPTRQCSPMIGCGASPGQRFSYNSVSP